MQTSLAIALLLLSGISAFAEQFVLFDVTFTYTKADADNSKPSKSHYYVKGDGAQPGSPARLDEPGGLSQWDRPHPRGGDRETRGRRAHDMDALLHPESRARERLWLHRHRPLPREGRLRARRVDDVVLGERLHHLVGGHQADGPGNQGRQRRSRATRTSRPDSEKFFPTKMRITMVQVSAGSKYDPSLLPNPAPTTP